MDAEVMEEELEICMNKLSVYIVLLIRNLAKYFFLDFAMPNILFCSHVSMLTLWSIYIY
jgi:hypothetical protein